MDATPSSDVVTQRRDSINMSMRISSPRVQAIMNNGQRQWGLFILLFHMMLITS